MKAVLVKDCLEGFTGSAKLYKLEPELEGFEFVAVSKALSPYSGPETYIFGADAEGNVTDWSELTGSSRGKHSHEDVLRFAGYTEFA